MDLSRWRNRVAVVTGASAGIGAATVVELCKHGIVTVGLARRVEKMEEVRKNLSAEQANLFHAIKCDVSNNAEIVQVFSEIEKKFGGIDILINNAGVAPQLSLINANNSDEMRRVIDTNVMSIVHCTREAVKSMRERNVDGHIIHINSIGGHSMSFQREFPLFGIYIASKYAVTALAEQHRHEFMRERLSIKVTSLSPGAVLTEMMSSSTPMSKEVIDEMMKSIPWLQSKDIADAIVYLLSTPQNVLITELTIRPMNETF